MIHPSLVFLVLYFRLDAGGIALLIPLFLLLAALVALIVFLAIWISRRNKKS